MPGTVNSGDVYVRDLVSETTTRASVAALSMVRAVMSAATVTAYNHRLSADGQFVAFEAGPYTGPSVAMAGLILRYNVASGVTDLVHANAAGRAGPPENIRNLDMTPDGRFVAFVANTNTSTCIEVWDAQSATVALASGDSTSSVSAYRAATGQASIPPGGSSCS